MNEATTVLLKCGICNEAIKFGDAAVSLGSEAGHADCYNDPFEAWARTQKLGISDKHQAQRGWKAAMDYVATGAAGVLHGETDDMMTFPDSAVLRSATYGRQSLRLFLTFQNGSVWRYDGVPLAIWEALQVAESAGSYYSRNIKGTYESMRLKE